MKNQFDLVKFVDGDFVLNIRIDQKDDTIWLSKNEIAELFDVSTSNIERHIKNILKENELDETSICLCSSSQFKTKRKVKRYNLDMIMSIGYRIKSTRGTLFRRWINKVLKPYLLKGYSFNQRMMSMIKNQDEIVFSSINDEQKELLDVVKTYTKALDLLDAYDHQCLIKPKGNSTIYELTYRDCRTMIDSMKFNASSKLFGVEKEEGKLNGILAAIYQNVFGKEVYASLEEKAAHLLYFLVKDHPFIDGCKRIAATLFLEFLNKNQALIQNGKMVITNSTLVAITILVAESKPEEMDIMIQLIMNLL